MKRKAMPGIVLSLSLFMPYFFSSALAHNLHLHQNLGPVAWKTRWLHACLYASCNNKVMNVHPDKLV